MDENKNVVPFDVIPQIYTGSFLTKEQAEQFKEAFKDMTVVVRCKDCKHRPIKPDNYKGSGFSLNFPDYKCPCLCDDPYYSWYPDDNWFCADGERR